MDIIDVLPPVLPPVKKTELIYDDTRDTSSVLNVLLIDSNVGSSKIFFDSANATTFPIIYSYSSDTEDLLHLLQRKFTHIQRMSFVFHDPINNFKTFMNNKEFFINEDISLGQTVFSDNVVFLQKLITEFSISNFDFLACNSLNYDNWKAFYGLLHSSTNVICGASNNNTGNLNSGSDWVMENTNTDIRNIYFNDSITNFSGYLAILTISKGGGTIYFKYDVTIKYSQNNQTSWVNATFPIQIINTIPSSTNALTVKFTNAITFTNSDCYFICGSEYIKFDGTEKTCLFQNIPNYPGLIQNGTGSQTSVQNNITIQNIFTAISGTTTLNGGYICQHFFGYDTTSPSNLFVNNCYSSGTIGSSNGGIFGQQTRYVTATNCYSSGAIDLGGGGGIFGESSNGVTATNCYSSGAIGLGGGGIFGQQTQNVTATNCYIANGNWSDTSANANGSLIGTPTQSDNPGTIWYSPGVNTPYTFSRTITSVVVGSADLTINIFGTNFSGVTTVTINGTINPSSFIINSSTSITATLSSVVPVASVVVSTSDNQTSNTFIVNPPIYPTCFPAGTPILTDQGIVAIEKINPKVHTIQNKRIVAITQTITNENYLVCIEKNALGVNIPSEKTIISRCHSVLFDDKMCQARYLNRYVKNKKSVYNVKYNGEILYNILMEKHEKMNVNNMTVETMNPKNIIAKLYSGKYNEIEKNNLIIEINECMKKNDLEKCEKISHKMR